MPKRFLKKHRVRGFVYHLGAIVFLFFACIHYLILDNNVGLWDGFCFSYFLFDYIAEFFDPHPDAPGTGIKLLDYFHRAFDGDNDEDQ